MDSRRLSTSWRISFGVAACVALGADIARAQGGSAAPIRFGHNVDNEYGFHSTVLDATAVVGWIQAGDVDGDGDRDLVAGGGMGLFVFRNAGNGSGWTRFGNLDPTNSMGANGGVLHDVDHDGDLDVISARYANDIGWWRNPTGGGALTNAPWSFHVVASISDASFTHDLILADLDGDGQARELLAVQDIGNQYWNAHIRVEWFRAGSDPFAPWQRHVIEQNRFEGPEHSHAGIDVRDIDLDGHADVAFANGWYEASDAPTGGWAWHPISSVYGISNTLARDLDGDGDADLVMAAGHHGFGVYWYENPLHGGGGWSEHVVDAAVEHPEGLQVADLDQDGSLEILAAELFFESFSAPVHNLYVYELDELSGAWLRQNVAPASHNHHLFQLAPIDGDCKLDVISQTAGANFVSFLRNVGPVPSCD